MKAGQKVCLRRGYCTGHTCMDRIGLEQCPAGRRPSQPGKNRTAQGYAHALTEHPARRQQTGGLALFVRGCGDHQRAGIRSHAFTIEPSSMVMNVPTATKANVIQGLSAPGRVPALITIAGWRRIGFGTATTCSTAGVRSFMVWIELGHSRAQQDVPGGLAAFCHSFMVLLVHPRRSNEELCAR